MQQRINWKAILRAGLLSGVIQVITGICMYVGGIYFAPWSTLISTIVLAACILLGVRWYRRRHGMNQVTFGRAFIVGAAIGVITGLVYGLYNVVSITFFYPDFINEMIEAAVLRQSEVLNPAQLNALAASLHERLSREMIAFTNLGFLAVLGAVESLVIAAALKEKRRGNGVNERW